MPRLDPLTPEQIDQRARSMLTVVEPFYRETVPPKVIYDKAAGIIALELEKRIDEQIKGMITDLQTKDLFALAQHFMYLEDKVNEAEKTLKKRRAARKKKANGSGTVSH